MNTRLPLKGGQNSSGVQGKRYSCAALDLEENQTDLSVVPEGGGGLKGAYYACNFLLHRLDLFLASTVHLWEISLSCGPERRLVWQNNSLA